MRKYHEKMDKRMFDFQDFYVKMAGKLQSGCTIAEVGLAAGTSAMFLAETLLNQGKKFTFHWIDNLAYGGPDQLNDILGHIGAADLAGRVQILPLDSLSASCRFPDRHFDFVFIDASHKYEETKADIRLWYRKIKEGGILAGHDYNEYPEVKAAVDEVIPVDVTRTDIPDRVFQPERVLWTLPTKQNHGIWGLRKKWYVNLT
jgi:predicted O-methyltransferase YrrM